MNLKRISTGVLLATSLIATAQANNLVVNGGFEAGDLSGWTSNRYYDVTDIYGVTEGSKAVEFAEGDYAGSTLEQTITTAVGTAYTVSFDWKATHPDTSQNLNFSIQDAINVVSQLGELKVSGGYTGSFNPSAPYTHFSTTFVANSALTKISFTDTSFSSYQADQMIDNVSVTAVPEPETYAMLLAGLGVMGAMARRRKAKQA